MKKINKMRTASHNTFTYCSPQWYLAPFSFIAKCQSKTIGEQYDSGIRYFDIRLRKNKEGEWEVAHNRFVYSEITMPMLNLILDNLNTEAFFNKEDVWIRVLHEVRNNSQAKYSTAEDFEKLCTLLVAKYPYIKFFGGQRTMDWRQDYSFNTNIEYIEMHASVRWPKWLHWWPWLYAKLYNKANERMYESNDIVVFADFV